MAARATASTSSCRRTTAEQQRRQQAQAAHSLLQQQQQQQHALFTPQDLTAAVAVAAHVQSMQGAAATRRVLSQPTSAAPPTSSMYSSSTIPAMTFTRNEASMAPLYSNMRPVAAAPKRRLIEGSPDSAASGIIRNSRPASAPSYTETERLTSSHNDRLDATRNIRCIPPVKPPPPLSRVARTVTASSAVSSASCAHTQTSTESDCNIPPAPAAPKSLVHQACELYPQSAMIVSSALRVDQEGARRRRSVCTSHNDNKRKRHLHEYPITIALHHDASLSVLQLLIDAAPDVLVQVDGDEQGSALSTALMKKCNLAIISLLLEANPDQVRVHDRYQNYPLHASCVYGACLEVVQLLASAYPSVLRKKNFHGMTPLDIAQRNAFCSDDVIDYLQQTAFGSLEEEAIHMEDAEIANEESDTSTNGNVDVIASGKGETACHARRDAGD